MYTKHKEEVNEYIADDPPKELADILEVVDAVASAKGIDRSLSTEEPKEKR